LGKEGWFELVVSKQIPKEKQTLYYVIKKRSFRLKFFNSFFPIDLTLIPLIIDN